MGRVPVTLAFNRNAQPLFIRIDAGASEQRSNGGFGFGR